MEGFYKIRVRLEYELFSTRFCITSQMIFVALKKDLLLQENSYFNFPIGSSY